MRNVTKNLNPASLQLLYGCAHVQAAPVQIEDRELRPLFSDFRQQIRGILRQDDMRRRTPDAGRENHVCC